jgi:hypothetical protein
MIAHFVASWPEDLKRKLCSAFSNACLVDDGGREEERLQIEIEEQIDALNDLKTFALACVFGGTRSGFP